MLPRISVILIISIALLFSVLILPARSAVSSCSVSLTPQTVYINDRFTLRFNLNNTSSSSIRWVKISSPSEQFEIAGGSDSQSAWSNINNVTNIVFHGSVLPDTYSTDFNVIIDTGDTTTSGDWTVQASDSEGGDSPTNCTGSLNLDLSDSPPDQSGPEISGGITVSDVSTNSVRISWNTNEDASSQLDYGLTSDYGTTLNNAVMGTSHSYTLSGLSQDTSYHFGLMVADSNGNETWTEDNTFTTAKEVVAGPTPIPIVITNTTNTIRTESVTKNVIITPTPTPRDITPPGVGMTTDFSKAFEKAPQVSGRASDDKGIAKVEYSVDDGRNWQAVDTFSDGLFTFLPVLYDDGNYQILVRAIDVNSNTGYSGTENLIIDRLPPQVGASLTSIGPQILSPLPGGALFGLSGQDQKIVLSASGGPVTIDLFSTEISLASGQGDSPLSSVLSAELTPGAVSYSLDGDSQSMYSLAKNSENGLWSGVISFAKPGIYQIKSRALDGANNLTERDLASIVIEEPGKVISRETKTDIADAGIEVFTLTQANNWALWDAAPFDQQNPQTTNKDGYYHYLLPPGTYYARITADGYEPVTSEIFSLKTSAPLTAQFTLNKRTALRLGPLELALPDFFASPAAVNFTSRFNTRYSESAKLIGTVAPSFILPSTSDTEFNSYSLRGRPSVLTFVNAWTPASLEQISLLQDANSSLFQSSIIFSQETRSKTTLFKKRGSYNNDFIIDQDGQLVEQYHLHSFPAHYFLDRKGIIKKVVNEVLTQAEIEKIVRDL